MLAAPKQRDNHANRRWHLAPIVVPILISIFANASGRKAGWLFGPAKGDTRIGK